MKKNIFTICILSFAFCISFAQPGTLDSTFGIGGKVTTAIGSGGDYGYSVALQSDGKIVLVGYCNNDNEDFALIRYNTNGTLDNSFGSNGKVTTDFGNDDDEGKSVAIQSDGKIIVAGASSNGTNKDFGLARFNSNGTLDTSFDSDGKVTTAIGNFDAYAQSVTLQSDGKIVVAGYCISGSGYSFAVARYNSNGSLDNTFGSGGKVITDFGNNGDVGCSVAIQNDGKIVVAGYSFIGSNNDFAIARYNNDGSLDNTFSSDGKVTTAIGSYDDKGYSVAIQNDGKIVVVGMSYNGSDDDFALARYNHDGTLDNSFDSDGKVTTSIGSSYDEGSSVVIQADGKIIVAGQSSTGTNYDFALIRYNFDGSLDNSFGSGGKVTTDFGNSSDDAYSVALQIDGKIVVAGVDWNGSNTNIALVRYNNSISLGTDRVGKEWAIQIYPNPTNGKIKLIGNQHPGTCIEIYNLIGEKIYSTTLNSKQETINLSSQPKGTYFVEMIFENERRSKKIILE